MTRTPGRRYATRAEAADYLSCSMQTIDILLADPKSGIHRYELRSKIRVDLAEIDAYMARTQPGRRAS